MLRLWGRSTSSNVMKILWLLEELGAAYERIDVGGKFGGLDTPQYRAMNPNSLVPVLVDGDFTLWESHAILRYLAETQPNGTRFWPDQPRPRALVNQWLDWTNTVLTAPQSIVFIALVRTPAAQRDMPALAAATDRAAQAWALLDRQLAHTPFVAGESLTLADIALGVSVHRWFVMPVDPRPETPHLHAWYQRLLERPAYQTHVAQPLA
jgi:glutathione S-transferase